MTIEQEIRGWDGKSADAIRQVYNRHASSSSFLPDILDLIQQEPLQNGATWLLKRHVETTGCPENSAVAVIYDALPVLTHWETKLHILQIIPYLPIAETHRPAVETFLRECWSAMPNSFGHGPTAGFTNSPRVIRSTRMKPGNFLSLPCERSRRPSVRGYERS